ncbi:gp15 putative lysozyme [Iodobacter phage PhiPLPE]|uniref:Endolysin n=1 Tax=Iodobacter phage PhiPLPE TaxID=551895 RepID=B5AX34_9CAUD|nr:gp15 putative lysozyme [Iodobacter phage PhiPLPE]ACG60337.1 gp15 putative lysozyme [Iodobacter phage PhiPLPE]
MAINKSGAAGGAAVVVAAIAALIMPSEGISLKAYKDPVGIPTICYGETQGVHYGDTKTKEECEAMLYKRIGDYLGPVDKMMPGLPDNRRIAYTDFAYNVGLGKLTERTKRNGKEIIGTSFVDLEKAGKWQESCERLNKYVYAAGKKLNGLVKRRAEEYQICMKSTEK